MIKQNPFCSSKNPSFAYFTHLPVLNAFTQLLPSCRCVEIGMGMFSTPLLLQRCDSVTSIEHDKSWYDSVVSLVGVSLNFKHILLPMPENVTPKTLYKNLKAEQREFIYRLFIDFRDNESRFDLAFIDGYSAERCIALDVLSSVSNVLIVHDSEQTELSIDEISKNMNCFTRFSFRSLKPFTDIFVHNDFKLNQKQLEKYLSEHLKPFGVSVCNLVRVS